MVCRKFFGTVLIIPITLFIAIYFASCGGIFGGGDGQSQPENSIATSCTVSGSIATATLSQICDRNFEICDRNTVSCDKIDQICDKSIASCDRISKICDRNSSIATLSQLSRTAMPDATPAYISSLTKRYEVTALCTARQSAGNSATGSVTPDATPTPGSVGNWTINLTPGTWTIYARAYDNVTGGNVVLAQTIPNIEITENDFSIIQNITLSLSQSDGHGKINLDLNFSTTDGIAKIQYTLTPLFGADRTPVTTNSTDVLSGTNNFRNDDIQAGTYSLVIKFLDSNDGTIYRCDQIVNVYSNMNTNTWQGTSPYIAGGVFNVTSVEIEKFLHSTFYVGGSGASDENSGTQYDPVATLSKAVSLVNNSSLSPAGGFGIFVNANANLGDDATLLDGKTLTISSSDPANKMALTFSTKKLTINGNATFKDIYLATSQPDGIIVENQSPGSATLTMNGIVYRASQRFYVLYNSGTVNITGKSNGFYTFGSSGLVLTITGNIADSSITIKPFPDDLAAVTFQSPLVVTSGLTSAGGIDLTSNPTNVKVIVGSGGIIAPNLDKTEAAFIASGGFFGPATVTIYANGLNAKESVTTKAGKTSTIKFEARDQLGVLKPATSWAFSVYEMGSSPASPLSSTYWSSNSSAGTITIKPALPKDSYKIFAKAVGGNGSANESDTFDLVVNESKAYFVGTVIYGDGSFTGPDEPIKTGGPTPIAVIVNPDTGLGIGLREINSRTWATKTSVGGSTAFATSDDFGKANWNIIKMLDPEGSAFSGRYPAFYSAFNWGITFPMPSPYNTGWYLGARNEWTSAHSVMSVINNSILKIKNAGFTATTIGSSQYWTSCADPNNSERAVYILMSTSGSFTKGSKVNDSGYYYVRAFREF